MAPNVIDYRRPDSLEDMQRLQASKLGLVAVYIFLGELAIAVLLAMFGPSMYSNVCVFLDSLLFCIAVIGTVWGVRAVRHYRRSAVAWIGLLLNLVLGLGGITFSMLMQYLLTHMET